MTDSVSPAAPGSAERPFYVTVVFSDDLIARYRETGDAAEIRRSFAAACDVDHLVTAYTAELAGG